MEKQCMAICGSSVFTRRLYEYILSKYSDDYEVCLFSEEKSYSEYVMKEKAQIVLAEEGFMVPKGDSVECLIRLSEEKTDKEKNEVFKYMAADKIVKDVMAIYAAGRTAQNVNEVFGDKAIIGIYTPVKRCFQTTFAITLGQILSKKKKTLYLNFESYSGFDAYRRDSNRANLMDLVYFSECDSKNFMMRVKSMTENFGTLDYISPATAYVHTIGVTKEQWIKLLDNLLTKTDYEYIILDLSEQVNGLLDVLRKCTRIYTITDEGKMASAKVAQYENMLKDLYYEDVIEKTENIKVPRFKEIPAEFEMLPYTELADYIKRTIQVDKEEAVNEVSV